MSVEERPPTAPAGGGGATAGPQPLGRQIAINSILNILGRAIYVVGWTLIAPWMLHRLGPDRFGLWSLLTVLSGLYLSFDLGLGGSITKFIAEYRATHDRASLRAVYTFGGAFYLALSLAFLATVILLRGVLIGAFRIAPALRSEAEGALIAAALGYGLLNVYMLMASVLSGLHRMDLWNRVAMGVTVVQLFGVGLVLSLGGGLVALFINTGLSLLLGVVAARIEIARLAPEIGLDMRPPPPGLLSRLTRYSAALQIINFGVLIALQLDKVLFGAMLSLRSVGQFELGSRVVLALWSAPSLLLPPLLPAVAHLDALGDRERVRRLYRRASRYVFAVAFPVAFGVLALAPALYTAWLGRGNADAARAAQVLAAMLAVNILTGVGSAVMRGTGHPGLEARYQILGIILHLGLSFLLIPRAGFNGGLWALWLSTSTASLWFVWRFHRSVEEPLRRFLVEVVGPPPRRAARGRPPSSWCPPASWPSR